jgi:F-type H+-transporting ATPase subunit b
MLAAVNDREQAIEESIQLAQKTQSEMKQLQAQNESLLKEARIERDKMIKEAADTSKRIIAEAKESASEQSNKIVADAQVVIKSEKQAAIAELKTQMAAFSLEIAEKVIRGELSSSDKQKALATELANSISVN